MASSLPIITTRVGAHAEAVEDGVSGLCVKPADAGGLARALNELLADPARQLAMGAAGKERVTREFSQANHVAALLGAYERARGTWEAGRGQPAAKLAPS